MDLSSYRKSTKKQVIIRRNERKMQKSCGVAHYPSTERLFLLHSGLDNLVRFCINKSRPTQSQNYEEVLDFM